MEKNNYLTQRETYLWHGKERNKAEVRDLVVQMLLKLGMVLVTLRYTA